MTVFGQMRKQKHIFSDVVSYVPMGFNKIAVRTDNVPREAASEMVSGNYFSGLGVDIKEADSAKSRHSRG